MANLVDTHCHIHSVGGGGSEDSNFTAKKWRDGGVASAEELIEEAKLAGVSKLICVGTDLADSLDAVSLAEQKTECYVAIGVHPHETSKFLTDSEQETKLREVTKNVNVVAVGEIGLDYYYEHSKRKDQIKALEIMLDLATNNNLPVIFHVRDAFDDFWPVYKNFNNIRGVLHSFTDDINNLNKALEYGLYIGQNGIVTFTKNDQQLEVAKKIPVERLLIETDAPYLAPKPYRGKVNRPSYVKDNYEFLANLRGVEFNKLADHVEKNANRLFVL